MLYTVEHVVGGRVADKIQTDKPEEALAWFNVRAEKGRLVANGEVHDLAVGKDRRGRTAMDKALAAAIRLARAEARRQNPRVMTSLLLTIAERDYLARKGGGSIVEGVRLLIQGESDFKV